MLFIIYYSVSILTPNDLRSLKKIIKFQNNESRISKISFFEEQTKVIILIKFLNIYLDLKNNIISFI